MNPDVRRIGVAGLAAVLPGVRGLCRLNKEPGCGDVVTLLGYYRDAAPGTVVAQDVPIVVPEDVGWWLRAEVYGARQVYRATSADVQLGSAQYRRRRYCDIKKNFLPLFCFSLSTPSPPPPPRLRRSPPLAGLIRAHALLATPSPLARCSRGPDKSRDLCVVKALRVKASREWYLAERGNGEYL